MAFTAGQLALIERSAQAMARAQGANADAADIADRLRKKFDPTHEQPYAQLQRAATSALSTKRTAATIEELGGDVLQAQRHGIDIGILRTDPRFAYRVVIRSTNPDTMEVWETATTIQSDTPLSFQAIQSIAVEHWKSNVLDQPYAAKVAGFGAAPVQDVLLVNAGRRA